MVEESVKKAANTFVDYLLEEQKLESYSVEITPGTTSGENFMGVITRIEIKAKAKNSKNVNLNLIMKSAPQNNGVRLFFPIHQCYLREIYIYNEVIPNFMKLQEEKSITNKFESIAKCYTTNSRDLHETLILQDMREFGYTLRSRHDPLDYNHLLLTVKEYGRFHALSFALRQEKPEVFNKLAANTEDSFFNSSDITEVRRNSIIARCQQALRSLDPIKHKHAHDVFRKNQDALYHRTREIVRSKPAGRYAVIGHGDGWVNNLLFGYQNSDKPQVPTDICFLDWQLARLGSPALDLSYFFFLCMDGESRAKHYQQLIDEYYNSLSSFLKQLGHKAEELFPYSVLQEHLKTFSVYGLYMTVVLLYILTAEEKEMPKFHKSNDQKELIKELSFANKRDNMDAYNSRMRSAILDFIKYDYEF